VDSQIKERLVGAAVLVAIGVWLIPWVLDGPGTEPVEAEPGLELPAVEEAAPIRTETVDLDRGAQRPEAPAEDAGRPAEQAVALVVPPSPDADGSDAASTAEPEATPAAGAGDGRAAARAEPLGAWIVQLGSFGELANAERLADRASTFGYAARVSAHTAGGRTLHRVRIGGFESRNEADAAVASLSVHGFVAQVVTPE
jgi:DedD protein